MNPIYGGTGSGNIDASEATSFKDAMEDQGFVVNETLWDFYEEGPGSIYRREESGMIAHASQKVVEVPWDKYTEQAKNSIQVYGDAAIVMISRVGGEGVDLDFATTNYLELDENENLVRFCRKKVGMLPNVKDRFSVAVVSTHSSLDIPREMIPPPPPKKKWWQFWK